MHDTLSVLVYMYQQVFIMELTTGCVTHVYWYREYAISAGN